jgi:hypothetical protein
MSRSYNLERSGVYSGVSFGPNGERDYSHAVEWLGPDGLALAAAIKARVQQEKEQRVQQRKKRAAEIEASRPGSVEKVFLRVADTLNLARERIESDVKTHRQPSERDRALVTKMSIEADLLRPHLSTWSRETGSIAANPDAGDVAEAISAGSHVKRWEETSETRGPETRTDFDELSYRRFNAPMYPVSTFLDAADDLCRRLYDEAANAPS